MFQSQTFAKRGLSLQHDNFEITSAVTTEYMKEKPTIHLLPSSDICPVGVTFLSEMGRQR